MAPRGAFDPFMNDNTNAATEATPVPATTENQVDSAAGSVDSSVDSAAVAPAAEASTAAPPAVADKSPADVAAELKQLFPALFTGGHKPLKLRVQADIQQRAPGRFTKAQLSGFLRRHTGSTGYLIALSKASHRFDLDGQQADELSDEHRKAAQEELTRRRGLQQERVELEQQQRWNRANLLRDYERTTLTLPNFCALKGVTPEELPGLLEIARKEAAEKPQQPRRDDRRDGRPDNRGGRPENRGGRPDNRGPRRDARPGGEQRPQGQRRPQGEQRQGKPAAAAKKREGGQT